MWGKILSFHFRHTSSLDALVDVSGAIIRFHHVIVVLWTRRLDAELLYQGVTPSTPSRQAGNESSILVC